MTDHRQNPTTDNRENEVPEDEMSTVEELRTEEAGVPQEVWGQRWEDFGRQCQRAGEERGGAGAGGKTNKGAR
ncbi:MAG: hypothetical protein FWD69_19705, partial [Polyangiaceae bacterium]|nr:hypothetical protein [Polyangiaceae bacterium]